MNASTVVASPSPALYRPAGALDTSTALAPYAGPWNQRLAAHLLRRAGFGGSPVEVARVASGSMHAAVDALAGFDAGTEPAGPPLAGEQYSREDLLALRQAQQTRDTDRIVALRKQFNQTRNANRQAAMLWWLDRMISTPAPLQEKLTLFWHGHFTSSWEKGTTTQALVDQNQLFRRNALGNIRELTLAVSKDVAMLRYLDNALNVKAHPNENYARELMELFTLGIGNYTEADVRESARAFTGWTIDRRSGTFTVDAAHHDDGRKTFLGQSGTFDGAAIVSIIFAQPACARWFATKLLGFFVYSDPEPGLVEAVAELLRAKDYDLAPVLSTLLRSNVFYSERAYRALVKSPVEFVAGAYQLLGLTEAKPIALAALRRMGQILFSPPNVKGWDGGAAWLNSQTLLTRENFASGLVNQASGGWLGDAMTGLQAAQVARTMAATILIGDVAPQSLAQLVAYLNGSGVSAQASLSAENVDERVRGAAYLTMAMPAYQLS
ncbi:MAG: DUF1800 domain-containing protein [Candidatus Velthaea sp.]|jgi:uncharacterized protein (DUF1800 family)